jgi:hypothetical protein
MFLRNELCANHLADFQLKKGLEHLGAVRERSLAITDRFAASQAQWLNIHVDFPVLQRLACPTQVGTAKVPGIQIQDTRMIRLMEVLLDGGGVIAGRRATELHHAVVTQFHLSTEQYEINQLRYDLRKLKAHGLLERDGHRMRIALPPRASAWHSSSCSSMAQPNSPLEAPYHKADAAIEIIIHLHETA